MLIKKNVKIGEETAYKNQFTIDTYFMALLILTLNN